MDGQKVDARLRPGFRGSSRLRVGRRSRPDVVCFVTTKTRDRLPVFREPVAAGILVRAIDWLESQRRWRGLCHVVMPDHIRLVFALTETPLPDLMKSLKEHVAKRIRRTLGGEPVVWQDGYFDHRLRSDERLEWTAFYCHRNPVRAGLALEGDDWPFFRCRADLWESTRARYDEFLALESERKIWAPPPAGDW
jgi:REP element-mobilizing transposase RayT